MSDCTQVGKEKPTRRRFDDEGDDTLSRKRPTGPRGSRNTSRRRRPGRDDSPWGRLIDRLIGSTDVVNRVINVGERAWDFLQKNRPVVNAETKFAHALPVGVQCWNEMENWNLPRAETYRISYENMFGMEVISLDFQLVYSYGGTFNGKGAYITNATILYKNIDVAWAFNVDASVEIPPVMNIATADDPIAVMQVIVRWKAKGFNHKEGTQSYQIVGDGRPTRVID